MRVIGGKRAARVTTIVPVRAPETKLAAVAQLVERVLGKDEVMGPNPISSSFVGRSQIVRILVRPVHPTYPLDPV